MAVESYNPERVLSKIEGRSRRELMAEITPVSGPEGVPPVGEGQIGHTSGEPVPQRPWHISEDYDPKRKDYSVTEEGNYEVFTDPLTGKEVARVLRISGGGPFGWGQGKKEGGADGRNQRGEIPDTTPTEPSVPGPTAEEVARGTLGIAGGSPEQPPPGTGGPEGPRGPKPPEMEDKEWETSPLRGRWIVERILELEAQSYDERYKVKTGLLSTPDSEKYTKETDTYLDKLYKDLQDYVRALKRTRAGGKEYDPRKRYEVEPKYQSVEQAVEAFLAEVRAEQQSQLEQEERFPAEDLSDLERDGGLATLIEKNRNLRTPASERPAIEEGLLKYFREAKNKGLLKSTDDILRSIYQAYSDGRIPRDQLRGVLRERLIPKNPDDKSEVILAEETIFISQASDPDVIRLAEVWTPYITRALFRFENLLMGREQPTYIDGEFRLDRLQERQVESEEVYWRASPTYPEYYEVTARTTEQFIRAKETFLQMIKGRGLGLAPDKLFPHLENFAKVLGRAAVEQARRGNVTPEFAEELRLEFEALSYVWGADYSAEAYNLDMYHRFMMAMALHEGPQRWVRLARSGDGQVGAFLWRFDNDPRFTLFYNSGGSRGQIGNDTVTQNNLQGQIREIIIEEGMGIALKYYDPYDEKLNGDQPEAIEARKVRALELGRIEAKLRSGREISQLSEDEQKIYNAFRNNLEQIGVHQSDTRFKNLYQGFDAADSHIKNYLEFKDDLESGRMNQDQLPSRLRKSIDLGRVQLQLKNGKKLTELSLEDQVIYQNARAQVEANFEVAFQMVGVTGEKVRRGGGILFVDRNSDLRNYKQHLQQWKDIPDGREQRIGRVLFKLRGLTHLPEEERVAHLNKSDQEFYQTIPPEQRLDVVDSLPVYLATQFVQYAVTRTKIEYSDESNVWDRNGFNRQGFIEIERDGKRVRLITKAAYRTYMVGQRRKQAIDKIHENGFESKFVFPKIIFNTEGDVVSLAENEPETIDIQAASESVFSLWSSHTYDSYQQENRHMLTDPEVIAAAKRIRAGDKPEDEDLLAIQLLTIDPTLRRTARLPTHQMSREIIIYDAAVEESNYGHFQIDSELFERFLPQDLSSDEMGVGYNREDFGGVLRHMVADKEYVSVHHKRFSRRYATELAHSPMRLSSHPDKLGAKGVLGLIEMHADPIGAIANQRIASQFALTKFINEMRYGWMLFGALYGYEDSEKGIDVEGLYEKPTNNNETLNKLQSKMTEILVGKNKDAEVELLHAIIESFGRLDRILKLIRVKESTVRNAQGALLTHEADIFNEDGSFNQDLVWGDKNTGSSRHSQQVFYESFIKWLTDPKRGGAAYPDTQWWYQFLLKPCLLDPTITRARWIFNKLGR